MHKTFERFHILKNLCWMDGVTSPILTELFKGSPPALWTVSGDGSMMFPGYFGHASGMFRGCFGDVSGMFQGYSGDVSEMVLDKSGHVSGMRRGCFGDNSGSFGG